MIDKSILQACLDAIEEKEIKLLSWGDTNIFFSKDELEGIIQSIVIQSSIVVSNSSVFNELHRQQLIVPVKSAYFGHCYHSRMAESIYLYSNLRQWFHGQALAKTKTLVSDFRFIRRPRHYPQRSENALRLIEKWENDLNLSKHQIEILKSLLVKDSIPFLLSGFQVRATERIIDKYQQHEANKNYKIPSATIVCSGTGSGKTLSFYLPTMTQLAQSIIANDEHRVRVLAIYPRNELLKDQFSETFQQARLLDNFLVSQGKRKIRIGTLFGKTLDRRYLKNKHSGVDYDLMTCPQSKCDGALRWLEVDNVKKQEVLTCSSCDHKIYDDEIALTRQSTPPDILFTSTEMMNQHLANSEFNHLFGVGQSKPIPLVLLDEVHTYEGSSGAQTSFLLKRWMSLSNNYPHFVGLSATLSDAQGFFADLTGTKKHNVVKVEPLSSELIEEGSEYLLALRGDPVSQSALLSTTIQSVMLSRRMLDNKFGISKGTYGKKTFVFTDDLDVKNRLFEQVADAEGWNHAFGKLTPNQPPLSFLRSNLHPEFYRHKDQLQQLGQDWSNAEYIGHTMCEDDRAIVSKTSSQDTGVDKSAEIVIATASLEVGFNDPDVGAVIQHKAPRGVASYLQRKGRAGRSRDMRPWMITILSDYGRDRIAFQRYEDLVNPEIKISRLPVKNSHIQKMQASLATLEWLAKKLHKGNIWKSLTKPKNQYSQTYLKRLLGLVETALSDSNETEKLKIYLCNALQLSTTDIEKICWQPPRSILMDFLPSLLQKLRTNWSVNGTEWLGVPHTNSPMPEFIPTALFSELILPSLDIRLLRGPQSARVEEWEGLGFFQGIKEFAPGRISKRYALNHKYESDWLVPDSFEVTAGENQHCQFNIHEVFGEHLELLSNIDVNGEVISVYQPFQVLTKRLELKNVTETSNAFLNWKSEFTVDSDKHFLRLPLSSEWKEYLSNICFFCHSNMQPVEVMRYTTGSKAQIKFKDKQQSNVIFNWSKEGNNVGIGTRLFVDGMRWQFSFTDEQLLNLSSNEKVQTALRFAFVQDIFVNAPLFEDNIFKANWAFECVTTVVMYISTTHEVDLETAIKRLSDIEGRTLLEQIPLELFQMNEIDEDEVEEQALQRDLISFFEIPAVVNEIQSLLSPLFSELKSIEYISWLRQIMSNTLAGGIGQLVCSVLPDIDERELNIDPVWNVNDLTIWLTESESGGVGVIKRIEGIYHQDPLNILNHLARSFQVGEYEQVDHDIFYMLENINSNSELFENIKLLRSANDYKQRVNANERLQKSIKKMGIVQSHSFNNILHTRLLKPGSSESTDTDLSCWMTYWRDFEAKYQIEIPLNLASYLIAKKIQTPDDLDINSLKDRVLGQLWPRGNVVRQSQTQFYNRFINENNRTERLLVEQIINNKQTEIVIGKGWQDELSNAIKASGKAKLVISQESILELNSIIAAINTNQIDQLGMLFHVRINRIDRQFGNVILYVELAEALQ